MGSPSRLHQPDRSDREPKLLTELEQIFGGTRASPPEAEVLAHGHLSSAQTLREQQPAEALRREPGELFVEGHRDHLLHALLLRADAALVPRG